MVIKIFWSRYSMDCPVANILKHLKKVPEVFCLNALFISNRFIRASSKKLKEFNFKKLEKYNFATNLRNQS